MDQTLFPETWLCLLCLLCPPVCLCLLLQVQAQSKAIGGREEGGGGAGQIGSWPCVNRKLLV